MTISDLLLYGVLMFLGLMFTFPVLMLIWARVKDTKLELPAKTLLGLPYWIVDWIFNFTVMTVIFCPDFPENWNEITTTRLKRYRRTGSGRRLRFADFACKWLNRFDPGHC